LHIPSVAIDLPVTEAEIVNNVWQVSSTGISHLSLSVVPGMPGNSIFYGHNWARLLGNLIKIKLGDEVIVSDKDNRSITFKVAKIVKVDPTDISILEGGSEPTLTLYTCSGFMDSKRLVVMATLASSNREQD
jgi:LPXTG-site transpeptidase (sortase) family protein